MGYLTSPLSPGNQGAHCQGEHETRIPAQFEVEMHDDVNSVKLLCLMHYEELLNAPDKPPIEERDYREETNENQGSGNS